MKIEQVAAQLYTVRDFIQSPADIVASMKKVRAIGYQAVQISGMGPIEESEMVKILNGEGLVCCATHESNATIITNPQAVADRLGKLNCKYTAYPFPGGVKLDDISDVRALISGLNASGKVLHDAGKVLTYHNHHIEFRRFDGQLMLDMIYNDTDPKYLQGEIDTYWVQYGGGDPAAWCERLKNRLPLLHLKDYAIAPDNSVQFAEIGNGNLNWRQIVGSAEKSGCEWFIVEQDSCAGDPFDSLKISFEYLRDTICS